MKKVRKLFITGLSILIPLVVTISIIAWFVLKLDSLFRTPVQAITGKSFMGLGLVLTAILIFITGFLATNYIGKRIISKMENAVLAIPIANVIYTSIKQLRDTLFYQKKRKAFKSAVLIEYPSKGIYTIGFITSAAPAVVEGVVKKKLLSIFVPTTPNPTSGMFVMIPKNDITYLRMSVDTAIKLIVSGGILSPDYSGKLDAYENNIIDSHKKEEKGD